MYKLKQWVNSDTTGVVRSTDQNTLLSLRVLIYKE